MYSNNYARSFSDSVFSKKKSLSNIRPRFDTISTLQLKHKTVKVTLLTINKNTKLVDK